MRHLARWVLLGLLAILLGLGGMAYWLAARPDAVDRLARLLQPYVPVTYHYDRAEGPLAGPVHITGLRVSSTGWALSVGQIDLAWRPAALLRRQLRIAELTIRDLEYQVTAPAAAQPTGDGAPPAPLALPVAIRVDRIDVQQACYQSGSGTPQCLDARAEAFALGAGRWSLGQIVLGHPRLQVSGAGSGETTGRWPLAARLAARAPVAGYPEWTGDFALAGDLTDLGIAHAAPAPYAYELVARLRQPLGPLQWRAAWTTSALRPHVFRPEVPETVVLQAEIKGAGTLEDAQIEAKGRAEGIPEGTWQAELAGRLDRSGARLDRLTMDGPAGRIRGEADIPFTGEDQRPVRADLAWQDLRWPGTPLDSPEGELQLSGTLARYDLALRALIKGAYANGRAPATVALAGQGDRSELRIAALTARGLLKGTVEGRGLVRWAPALSWDFDVRGRGLDPGGIDARWPGRLALDASTRGQRDAAGLQVQAEVRSLQGQLRGRPIEAKAAIAGVGSEWTLSGLQARSGRARLSGEGRWAEEVRLQARLDAPDLGDLWPDAAGRLALTAEAAGPRADPRIELTASAGNVRLDTTRLEALDLAAQWGGWTRPLNLNATVQGVESGEQRLHAAKVTVQGRPDAHRLSLSAEQPALAVQLDAAGGWKAPLWTGRMTALVLRPRDGAPWQLDQPAAVEVGRQQAALSGLCLRQAGQSLCADGQWRPESLAARLQLTDLDLAPWQRFLGPDWRLVGRVGGTVEAQGTAGRITGTIAAQADDVLIERQSPIAGLPPDRFLTLEAIRLSGEATPRGLTARLSGRPGTAGRLEAGFAIPSYDGRWQRLADLPAEGRVQLETDELAPLALLVTQLDQPRGRLSADLAWRGPWQAPEFSGAARLTEGAVDVPVAGLQLRKIGLEATPIGGDRLRLSGALDSGNATLSLDGQFGLQQGRPALQARLSGRDVLVADTAEARVRVSPDMQVSYTPEKLAVNGQLTVPEALLKPRELEGTVKPSGDEVILGPTAAAEQDALPWALDLRLILGDKVRFEGFGLKTDITGQLRLHEGSGTLPSASGELVLNGRYRAYGQDLTIERGRILYAGAPLDTPGLDLRASRKFGEQTVGVEARGLVQQPDVKVFSQPLLPQSDALAYLVLGRPLNQASGGDGEAMNRVAAAVGLAGGELLAQRIGSRFGLQDVEIKNEGDAAASELSVGRYLTPRLYVSYGVGVFNAVSTLRTRYTLSRRWTLRTESGVQSSVDAIYTLER
ncbi:MAG TPA: translocation/assembly module TamB domain-containing protein [Candidatus Macondimonas sp.]|nr:translocation/assembly module TamB domain-containing protein [Candidatus Macondimonas sp.]